MRKQATTLAALLLLVLLPAPHATAAIQLQQEFQAKQVYSIQYPGLLGLLSAGQISIAINYGDTVSHVGDTVQLGLTSIGPGLLASFQAVYAQSFTGTGCTGTTTGLAGMTAWNPVTPAAQNYGVNEAPYTAGLDAQFSIGQLVTVTGTTCSGIWHAAVCQSATVPACTALLFAVDVPVSIHAQDTNFHLCGPATTCTTASLSVGITSWPTLNANIATTGALTLSGTLGTQHLVIDQWPSLTAAVANTGTLNIVNSGGQTFTLTCPTNGCPLLNVQNSGGQTVAVSSLPQLQVAITQMPTLNIAQAGGNAWLLSLPSGLHITIDKGTLNAILNGTITTNTKTTLIGNSSTVLHFPETLHLCGTPGPNGTCQPIQETNAGYLTQTASVLGTMAWLVWIVAAAASRFLKRAMLRTVADLAIFAILALPMSAAQWQLLFLANAALFLYDMMAVMAGK